MAGTRESFVVWIDTAGELQRFSGEVERTRTSTRFRFESEAELVRILTRAVQEPAPQGKENRPETRRKPVAGWRNEP